jgi:hypothetical protein
MAKLQKKQGESLLTLQSKAISIMGFSHCQQAMMTFAIVVNTAIGLILIDQS